MKFAVVCPRPSAGAAELRRSLSSCHRIKQERVSRLLNRYDHVICWGATEGIPYSSKVLNHDVSTAVDKLKFFRTVQPQYLPPWTEDKETAQDWLDQDEHKIVVCRTKLRAHSGDGIVIARRSDEVVDAPLYTAYIRKKAEYRIHVARWHTDFLVQQKRKRAGISPEDYSPLIRSFHHGWVFCTDNVDPLPDGATLAARTAVAQCGLDFGAVDIVVGKDDNVYVLEVNSAPAISSPSTREFYLDSFGRL